MATTNTELKQFYGTGRRKSAVARVFLRPGTGVITINVAHLMNIFREKITYSNSQTF